MHNLYIRLILKTQLIVYFNYDGLFLLYRIFINMTHVLQGIIFVVDSSDRLRMVVAKDELDMLLQVSL